MTQEDEMLTPAEVSAEMKIAEKTLAQWRWRGVGPTYLKLNGHVRYRRSDLSGWIKSCAHTGSTP